MNPKRVVITGMGTINALGHNYPDFWQALVASVDGVAPIQQVDCSAMRFQCGAEVKRFQALDYFSKVQLVWLDRFAQFALIAAQEAVLDAKCTKEDLGNAETAVITGSCLGGKTTEDYNYRRLYFENKPQVHPNLIPNSMANAGASQIALHYGITGPVYTMSTACASSTHAIGHAFWLIRQGLVSRAITGGSEAPFSLGHLRAWESLRVVTNEKCRPFSCNRSGMVLGEGGGMLVLESLESAQKRGATIHAEMVGFGMSADAQHLTSPCTIGQSLALQMALRDANIASHQIHYLNAHGTGTTVNDKVESQTVNTVFPEAHQHLYVNSTKAAHGHLLGASGAVEAIATVLAIKHQTIPPTLHFSQSDRACNLPIVAHQCAHTKMEYALSSSFAFGGLNAALIVKRF